MMRAGKRSLTYLGGSLIAAVLITLWPVKTPLQVETTVVQAGELVQTVALSGIVENDLYPCVSPMTGQISRVYVQQGACVNKGDLLFKMDTTLQERALEELYKQRFMYTSAMGGNETLAAAYSAAVQQDLFAQEQQLLLAVEASYVRAQQTGVVAAVYAREGEMILEKTALGAVRGIEKQIQCVALNGEWGWLWRVTEGVAEANGKKASIVLKRMESIDGVQRMAFEASEPNGLAQFSDGEKVQLEFVKAIHTADNLIPLSCIDADECVWFVEAGKVHRQQIQTGECNRTHMAVNAALNGKTLVVQPERYSLEDGMEVLIKR